MKILMKIIQMRMRMSMMIQSTSYTSILACRQEHTSHWPLTCIEECWRWSIAGGEYCDTAGTPVALEHGDSFVPGQHCTAVLEHSGTAALAHCCTLALALPGIVVEVPASQQTDTLGVEFQNIFVPQLFVVQFHIAVLELWSTAALALCCTVVVVNQCTVAWVPASALAGTVVWEHWSTAPRAPAGSSGWAPGNTPALVLHCIVVLAHLHTVL